ncbi:MAG: ATP-binding protein, partial [Patescibacteria group bacterium]
MANNNNKNGNNNDANVSYEAKDIYVLEGLDPVRKRPGMYIGSTGVDGVHHLVWEVVDNSLDEAMAGFATDIEVAFLPQNRVRVKDNGRGIPVEIHKQTKKSALETVLCTLHAGGKFGGESYKISGGLHGVGVSVVNALSIWLRAEVCRDGYLYVQEYSRGKPKHNVKKIGKCNAPGTTIYFEPDPEIFKEVRFNWDTIISHLRQQAYLVKGTKIVIRDLRQVDKKAEEFFGTCQVGGKKKVKSEYCGADTGERSHGFFIEGGIVSYVKFLNNDNEARHNNIFYANREEEGIQVEVAFQYTDDLQGYEMSFANNIHTVEGGMHLTGFRTALTRGLNDYARKNGFLKNSDENLMGDDVREGITAVISVKLREPQFEGQTKAKLG